MEILIGFAIATLLVIGWAKGNLFACVFLSLGVGCIALLGAVIAGGWFGAVVVIICLLLMAGIWGPRSYNRAHQSARPWPPTVTSDGYCRSN